MSIIDIILGIILIYAFYRGLSQGLFSTLASLLGLILGVYGAMYFSGYAADYLANNVDWNEQTIQLAAFAITFLVILVAISIAGKLLTKVADFAALGFLNKLLGGLFNAIKFAFIISVLFMFINASTAASGFVISEEKKADSILYEPVASIAPLMLPHILKEVETYKEENEEDEDEPIETTPTIEEETAN
ncbi:hypothetical protein ULMS_05240 [Patiriisocius marinistellae]|uniref:Colicin V production protein n=1 Tax=Patiriisocius marinistellae TaxID=2494560 RepID=A0A5J4FY28_9FLAO|nr:CvpA family protein [Patiriisocius marinistellae]GEQ85016.1 hypothetical protein ULMS_05240 [Patiriisocius marinistellae]